MHQNLWKSGYQHHSLTKTPKRCPGDMTQSVTNVARIGGITRSDRIYAPESLRRENPTETLANSRNKENSKGK
ncbi:hypothetical protein CR513_09269, partial [Mucuna pruriens]